MATLTYRGTREGLIDAVRQLPAVLAGRLPDRLGIARGVQLRIGVAALSQIQQDFLVKSRGGTGKDGVTWDPLRRATIAQRRTTPGELKSLGVGGKRVRGLLTAEQDKVWRQVFVRVLMRARLDHGEKAARGFAAKAAWAAVKTMGAKTKLDVLGGRTVDIGRDTGRMLRSLAAGVDDRPSGAAGQVFETPAGAVVVGTNVPYFPRFNARRQVFPADGTIPDAWVPAIQAAAGRGLIAAIEVLSRGR